MQQQSKQVDVNLVVNELAETVAAQAVEIAKLKAYIKQMEKSDAADSHA